MTRFSGPAAGDFAAISEPWRLPLLGVVAGIFAAAVLVVGGLRGARSLVALALTLTVVVKLVIPLLLRGYDPILLAVSIAGAVTLVTLLLTEGFSRITLSATVGTFAALILTAALAAIFTAAALHRAAGQRGDRVPDPAGRRADRPARHPAGGNRVRRPRRSR